MSTSSKKPTKSKTAPKTPKKSAPSKAVAKAPAKRASTPRKTAPRKKAAPKPAVSVNAPVTAVTPDAPVIKAAAPTVVNKPQPVVLGPVMRKKELIDTVVTRTGMKKKDAKPVIEGMLAVLGEALAEGRELILPPLGKVIVRKEKALPNGKMMIVKVRQSKPPMQAVPAEFSDTTE